jgi:SH3 domain protein
MKTHQRTLIKTVVQLFSLSIFAISLESLAFEEQKNLPQTLSSDSQQAFITDELFVYMHAGAGKNYRIVGTINAGSQIKVTGIEKSDYSQLVDENNTTSWIATKYITQQPGLRFVSAELNAQLASATDLNNQLDSQLNNIKETVSNLNDSSSQLNNEVAILKNQLASSQAELKAQDTDIQKQWFFTGAIVLAIGLILGLIIPKLGGRRRGSMDNWK